MKGRTSGLRRKNLRAAIVGLGRIASTFDKDPLRKHVATHAGAYRRVNGVELCAACDLDETKLREFGTQWGVQALYTDFDRMLEVEKPEILSICAWSGVHYPLAVKAVKAGVKAVFCEKPLTERLDQADELVRLCRKQGVILAVNHSRRWDTGHERVKKLLEAGRIGEIRQVQCYYTAGIANTGTHLLDLLNYYLGDALSVSASPAPVFGDKDPTLSGQILFKNNVLATLSGLEVRDFLIFELDFYGSKGRVRIKHSGFDLQTWKVGASPFFSGYKELTETKAPFSMKHKTMMLNAVSDIAACVRTGRAPKSTGTDGLKALELICAFRESWKTGKRISLPLKNRKIGI